MSAVKFSNISKKFGDFYANEDISFDILSNTVHCILGENGAGKSTLMNILYGIHKQDSGKIFINNEEKYFSNPADAISCGIGMVHQHFMLIDDFTVMENVILGDEYTKGIAIDFKRSKEKINLLIDNYKLNLNISEKISELNFSQQQKVEILKMLYRNSDILIFDEPTSVLSPAEIEDFFHIVEDFKKENKTILLITHKLKEVKQISDRVTVLSKGKVTFESDNYDRNINVEELGRAIVGHTVVTGSIKKEKPESRNEFILQMKNVSMTKGTVKKLDNLNLSLECGVIHGICGVEGNGQSELVDIISGLEKNFTGELITAENKISLVPDDRINKGMIKEFSVSENILLKKNGRKFISNEYLNKTGEYIVKKYDIRLSSLKSPLHSLSGGNQQKVIFAREIETDNKILVFVYPTRGVDINSSKFIHNKITEQRNESKAILLISSDLDELLSLSDRLSVIYNGSIIKTFEFDELTGFRESKDILEIDTSSGNSLFERIGKLMIGVVNE